MKKTLITDILIAILPSLLFFGLYFLFIGMIKNPMNRPQITSMVVYVLIPAIVGVIGLFVAVYSYVNRNSFLFIFLFIGSLLANVFYGLATVNILIPIKLLRMTFTSQLTFVIIGLYVACFWMSLISKIKNPK